MDFCYLRYNYLQIEKLTANVLSNFINDDDELTLMIYV